MRETLNEPGLQVLTIEETVMDDGSGLVLQEVLAIPSIQPRGTIASAYMIHNWKNGSTRIATVCLLADFDVSPGDVRISGGNCTFDYTPFIPIKMYEAELTCKSNVRLVSDGNQYAKVTQKYTISADNMSFSKSATLTVQCDENLKRTASTLDKP